jgi:S1-C subfamily serine protease
VSRLIPDWLLYIVVIAAVVFALFRVDRRAPAPPAPEEQGGAGAFLPPPSELDPRILVEVGPVASGLGSAFAIAEDGWWLTARHVVDGCQKVGLIVSRGAATPVREVKPAFFADIALLRTDGAASPLALDTSERQFQIGQRAYHVGFPQGRGGEAYSRLIGRERLVARGRYDIEEPVLAWAELGRTGRLRGSLAGMSGGPALAANGQVIGITVAESARRGRIYTAAPSSILRLLRVEQVNAAGAPTDRLSPQNYGQTADDLRRALAVAQVVCIAPQDIKQDS